MNAHEEETIEEIILRNGHVRGIDRLRPFLPGDFCRKTARVILHLREIRSVPKVLITTGFNVGGAPETDGPPGAYFLYRALKRLGFPTGIITDTLCAPLFEGVVPESDLIKVPIRIRDEAAFRRHVFGTFSPSLLVAVERCGRTRTGAYRDMRGNDISAVTAPLDVLFLDPPEGCVTVGVGDGGNEIGMGGYEAEISRLLDVAPCVVPADHLVLATVSNWGACGLVRCLEVFSGVPCVPEFEEVAGFIALIVSRGAVDGMSRRRENRVDGYDLAQLKRVIEALRTCDVKSG